MSPPTHGDLQWRHDLPRISSLHRTSGCRLEGATKAPKPGSCRKLKSSQNLELSRLLSTCSILRRDYSKRYTAAKEALLSFDQESQLGTPDTASTHSSASLAPAGTAALNVLIAIAAHCFRAGFRINPPCHDDGPSYNLAQRRKSPLAMTRRRYNPPKCGEPHLARKAKTLLRNLVLEFSQ